MAWSRHRRLAMGATLSIGAALLLVGFAASPAAAAGDRPLGDPGLAEAERDRPSLRRRVRAAGRGRGCGCRDLTAHATPADPNIPGPGGSDDAYGTHADADQRSAAAFDVFLCRRCQRTEWRKNIYTNLFFKYLEMGYEIGHISEVSLRQHFAGQFRLTHAREFWRRVGDTYRVDAATKATRRFYKIVEEEHRRALGRPGIDLAPTKQVPPGEIAAPDNGRACGRRTAARCVIAGVGVGAGLVAGTAIQRWMSNHWRGTGRRRADRRRAPGQRP